MAYEVDRLWKKCEQAPGFAAVHKEYARSGSGSFGVTFETDGALAPSVPFGNCARQYSPGCEHETAEFAGTHAALGGCVWTTLGDGIRKMDQETSLRVWSWMSARLLQCGLRAFALH